jgi:hypothetical protein
MGPGIVTVVGSVVRAIGIVWSIGIVTVRAVIPPRVAQPDPDSETEVVAAKVVMVTEVMMVAEVGVVAEVMEPRVAEAMEGVAAEVASMPTTEMPMSTDVPTAMAATGERDRRPTDHKRDAEDSRPENRPTLHENLHPQPRIENSTPLWFSIFLKLATC